MPDMSFMPRLFAAPKAAHYLSVSETKLRELDIPRRVLDGKKVYHIADLDAYADGLPIEGEGEQCDEIDKAFGTG